MIIGNKFSNLLQVIAVEGNVSQVVEKNFTAPLFHRIIAKELDVIDIEIRNLTGTLYCVHSFILFQIKRSRSPL